MERHTLPDHSQSLCCSAASSTTIISAISLDRCSCINQYDADERGGQVAKMLSIFQRAKQVLVWLGLHGTSTNLVCAYATRKGSAADNDLESVHSEPVDSSTSESAKNQKLL